MKRLKQEEAGEDFESWKFHRFEVEETHQAEFALK
jgi:hypothetical protein